MELTKDELYEIEKILDIYAGWVSDKMSQLCNTSIKYEGLQAMKKVKDITSPLAKVITELDLTYDYVLRLRKKIEEERKK